MRSNEELNISADELRKSLIPRLAGETYIAICDSCNMPAAVGIKSYELLIAWGKKSAVLPNEKDAFDQIESTFNDHGDWMFGVFSYDLKNSLEKLESTGHHPTETPSAAFFIPEHLVVVEHHGKTWLKSHSWNISDLKQFLYSELPVAEDIFKDRPDFVHSVDEKEYVRQVEEIKRLIEEGDVYELNYCHEFHAQPAKLHSPIQLFQKITSESPAPFSSFFKFEPFHLIGCSPERFLKRVNRQLISQPIKGTAARGSDPNQDELQKQYLAHSIKEKAENVMIVDLVRNDLARSCETGSVQVQELFGIYSFPRVHQMISTISGTERAELPLLYAFKNAFPMGSMTGAPKIAAMQIIDRLEKIKRGWYSGAFGYIAPNGDFDFNVVIRSYVYNQRTDYLSVMAGGAITIDSEPLQEYEESLLKARFLLERIF